MGRLRDIVGNREWPSPSRVLANKPGIVEIQWLSEKRGNSRNYKIELLGTEPKGSLPSVDSICKESPHFAKLDITGFVTLRTLDGLGMRLP